MALKNHALDSKILQAAKEEFLQNGYEKTSLRKIASQAGATIGAIYTRYPTKDMLFLALVQPLVDRIGKTFTEVRSTYFRKELSLDIEQLGCSIKKESEEILHLLFDDYDRAVLLLCRSSGSSMGLFFDEILRRKIRESLMFFRSAACNPPDERVLSLLISSQYHMYFQIIHSGYDYDTAKNMMQDAMTYHTGGWIALLDPENSKKSEEKKHEV